LTWHRLNLYAGLYSISIEKLRRGQNDTTCACAAAAASGLAVGVVVARRGEAGRQVGGVRAVPSQSGVAWLGEARQAGRRHVCRAEPARRAACVRARTEWESFYLFDARSHERLARQAGRACVPCRASQAGCGRGCGVARRGRQAGRQASKPAGGVRAVPSQEGGQRRVCVRAGTEWERFYLFDARSHKC
jgi:hypothetical protein